LNENASHYKLKMFGTVTTPKINFDPPFLMLTPVPLDVKTEATINIIPQDYLGPSEIHVELPELELEDGDSIYPLSVQFPEGHMVVLSSDGTNKELFCRISFRSSTPVSLLGNIFFIDNEENRNTELKGSPFKLLQQQRIAFLLYTRIWHFTALINK
ncbi:CFA47 protein, partial [Chloroceryle aenea]|nr:CFA47 protein [Chloroceryle aenea]